MARPREQAWLNLPELVLTLDFQVQEVGCRGYVLALFPDLSFPAAASSKRGSLRQVVAQWSKEGRIRRTGRGMYEKT